MNLGPAEVAVILLVALLVFGPSRLPEISRQVGGAMRELRKMQSSLRSELDNAMREEPGAATSSTPRRSALRSPESAPSEPDHTDAAPGRTGPAGETGAHETGPPADDGFAGPRDSFL